MVRILKHLASWSVLCVVIAGCAAGDGEGLDANGRPIGEVLPGGDAPAGSFAEIQNTIFTPICTACHSGASAPLGLQLDAGKSYTNLVGVASVQVSDMRRVKPGDSAASYLISKIEGTASVGGRMPLGGSPLSSDMIDMIKSWIDAGAPATENAPADPEAPLKLVSISPTDGSTVSALPGTITATFSHDLTLVDADSFFLERSGGDGTFEEGNEVRFTTVQPVVSDSNVRIAFLDLGEIESVDDDYRISLKGEGDTPLMDARGERLDGDDDDQPGGDLVVEFTVSGALQSPPGGSAWQTIQDNVLTPSCAICHAGGNAPEGLRLDAANAYAMLVGTPATQRPDLQRVLPGNPDQSYLIMKIEGTASDGLQMPRGGPALSQATIDYIRAWISNGANLVDDGDDTAPPPPPPEDPLLPTWRSIQDKVFTPICTECHSGGDPPGDLNLDENNSYGLLVNQESDEEDGFLRVAPGNANQSYLIRALEGTAEDTPRMPFNRPPLPQSTIDIIREWIDNGANP